MKRTANMEKHRAPNSGHNQTKRSKSAQACSSCRKLKTRCELLDAPSNEPCRCHRCKVLGIACSFEGLISTPPRQHPSQLATLPLISQPPTQGTADSNENSEIQLSSSSSSTNESLVDSHDDVMKPDDILAHPPNTSWPGIVKIPGTFDWSATPMFAMQNVTSWTQSGDYSFINNVNASLANMLSPDRVESLLNM
jgi:hypothetical protein